MSTRTISQEIQYLVEQGICLIPISEKLNKDGKSRVPVIKWTGLTMPIDILDLFDLMMNNDTNTVAMVLGKPSGRLVCIDVDTKYKPGFDAVLFSDLKDFYPNLFEKFRIEKTPSGGYHIYYRIDGQEELPGCLKPASREATPEEIEEKPKGGKTRCFLEIKCQGGLSHCYPDDGYILVKDNPVPLLTQDEHNSIRALCESYNEVVKVENVRATKEMSDFYSENPYEHFNRSEDGSRILEEFGWVFLRKSGVFNYYTKPGSKEKKVSASFNIQKCLYKIFTAGTELDPKAYSPSILLAELKYGGDRKELYSYLVAKGYGKIKKAREKSIIKRSVSNGTPIPANVSEDGKKEYEEQKQKMFEKYPYGVFWKISDDGVVKISREDLYRVIDELGFRTYRGVVCRVDGYLIYEFTENEFYNELKKYISKEESSFIDICNAYEAFLQNSGKFTISRTIVLDESVIMRSSKLVSYKFYKNCYVRIDKDVIETLSYNDVTGCIWVKDIKDRNFSIIPEEVTNNSIYYDFLNNAIGMSSYLKKCVGYCAHDYRDEQGYFILASEQCENPKHGAGAGKNVFWDLFKKITTFKSTPASMIKKDNQLLQSWNGERLFCFADMPKNFDMIFFKEMIGGSGVQRKLYVNEVEIGVGDMCKMVGSTNYSVDDSDPGVARRIRMIEFTDYFTQLGDGALVKKYGKMFPMDWDEDDYLGFDNLMMVCIQEYIASNSNIEKAPLTAGGWSKQFEQKYKHLYEFIIQNIEDWVRIGRVNNEYMKKIYRTYCEDNTVRGLSAYTQNKAIEDYCLHFGIPFVHHGIVWRENGIVVRGREFGAIPEGRLSEFTEPETLDTSDIPF